MKIFSSFFKYCLIIAVVTAMFFVPVSPVQAGSNGQQISVTACNAVRVVIQGKNQSGNSATYTLNKAASACGSTNINGWWWIGTVTTTAYYNVSSEYPYYNGQSVSVNVPKNQTNSNYVNVNLPSPTTRQWINWRAQTWVNDRVSYNQNGRHDGYRTDCSGYVSFAWQLSQPGPVTSQMSSYSYQISFDSLQPGDALNNPSDHIMLFMGWVNQSQGTFTVYEENGTYNTWRGTLTLNKSTGVITNGSYKYPGTYKAMRKNGL